MKHLDNDKGKDKDNFITEDPRSGYINNNVTEDSTISKDNTTSTGNCDICNTRYNNKNKHDGSDDNEENVKQKKLADVMWREKIEELGLDHNIKFSKIRITSGNYEVPKFLIVSEAMYNINSHNKFTTFDVV